MEKRYQKLLEKHLAKYKSNDIVDMEPTLDTMIQTPDVNNVKMKGGKSANTTNKQAAILPSDSMATRVVNY